MKAVAKNANHGCRVKDKVRRKLKNYQRTFGQRLLIDIETDFASCPDSGVFTYEYPSGYYEKSSIVKACNHVKRELASSFACVDVTVVFGASLDFVYVKLAI